MTEFEKNMLAFMQEIKTEIKTINNRLDNIESDVAVMKTDMVTMKSDINTMKSDITTMQSDIEDIKENTAITRTAANYNGEKIEELATELQKANIIA
ncbi:MAG: hypothetical protein NC485_12255 [Ruminococcus flavefaciens]|nr:hypothetical protein [Ruminococcus flavefaciens]MCM1060091.1 hypothetical protein [Eubacterium sp.]